MTTAEAFLEQAKREHRYFVQTLEEEGYEYILADDPGFEETKRRVEELRDDAAREELLDRLNELRACLQVTVAASAVMSENDVDPFPDSQPAE